MFGLDITSLYTSKDSESGPRAMIYMICRGTNRARQSLRCSDINERFLNRIASMINQHTCRTSHKSYQFIYYLLSEILNLTSPMCQVFHYALFTFHIHHFILQSSLIASITSRQLVRRRRQRPEVGVAWGQSSVFAFAPSYAILPDVAPKVAVLQNLEKQVPLWLLRLSIAASRPSRQLRS